MMNELKAIYKMILDRQGKIEESRIMKSGFVIFYPVQVDAMAVISFFIDDNRIQYLREEDKCL